MIHIKNVNNSDFENLVDIVVIKKPSSIYNHDFKEQAEALGIELPSDRVTVIDNLFLTGPTSKSRFNILYPNGQLTPGIQVLYNSGIGDLNNTVIEELLDNHLQFTLFESNLTRSEKSKYIDLYEERLNQIDKTTRFINQPSFFVNTKVAHGFDAPIIEWYETYELTIDDTFVVHVFSAPYTGRLDDVTLWKLKQIPDEKVFHEKSSFNSLNKANSHLYRLSKGNLEPALDDHTPFVLLNR